MMRYTAFKESVQPNYDYPPYAELEAGQDRTLDRTLTLLELNRTMDTEPSSAYWTLDAILALLGAGQKTRYT